MVEFIEEKAEDQGGVTKEFFELFFEKFQSNHE